MEIQLYGRKSLVVEMNKATILCELILACARRCQLKPAAVIWPPMSTSVIATSVEERSPSLDCLVGPLTRCAGHRLISSKSSC